MAGEAHQRDLKANTVVFKRIELYERSITFVSRLLSLILYNLKSLAQSQCIVVPLLGAKQVTERRVFSLRGFVTLLAIVGLTITLAGRVFQGSLYPSTSAHSGTSYERVQHRDSDAARWVPPTASYTLLWTAERSVAPDPIEQIHFHPHYDSLYNRPPPVSESRHSASF